MQYRINEIFYSLQGEGFHTGIPSVFVRFSGCNLHCEFCDTDHAHGTFYVRQQNDKVVELIMLHNDSTKDNLIIINLTGDIDEEFTELLTKSLENKK